jgi:uncharacterized protein YigE (DUF2233 family)
MDILEDVTFAVSDLLEYAIQFGLKPSNFSVNREKFIEEATDTVGNSLGKGGVGSVFTIQGEPRYILKITSPRYGQNACLDKYVASLEDNVIYTSKYVPLEYNGEMIQQKMITMPNVFSEPLIGGLLTKAVDAGYCNGFCKIYRMAYTHDDMSTYIIMERYKSDLASVVKSGKDFLHLLFQVCYNLMVGQNMFRFTHYDLHMGNILYIEESEDFIAYPLPDGETIYIKNPGFSIRISDFGMARAEYGGSVITPITDTCPHMHLGVFDPNYDIIAFMGNFVLGYEDYWNDLFFNDLDLTIANQITNLIFDADIDMMDVVAKDYYTEMRNGDLMWRPKGPSGHKYHKMMNMEDLLLRLVDILEENKIVSHDNPGWGTIKEFKGLPKYDLDRFTPYIEDIPVTLSNTTTEITHGILLTSYKDVIKAPIESYNRTPVNRQVELCNKFPSRGCLSSQYITEVLINRERAHSFKFSMQCCKVDPIDYLIQSNQEGIVINGGFFNLTTHTPIGYYKDETYELSIDHIPEIYRPYFGIIGINGSGDIVIDRIFAYNRRHREFDYIATSGPLLVFNSNIVFDERTVRTIRDIPSDPNMSLEQARKVGALIPDVSIFQCDIPRRSGEEQNKTFLRQDQRVLDNCEVEDLETNTRVRNCSTIKPGELSHASNPNPRSMLVITEEDNIAFVVVEGREDRGFGMDLVQLAAYAKRRFNAKFAINLDGGRSSRIIIRKPGDSSVYTMTDTMKMKYPSGDLIAFTRDRV